MTRNARVIRGARELEPEFYMWNLKHTTYRRLGVAFTGLVAAQLITGCGGEVRDDDIEDNSATDGDLSGTTSAGSSAEEAGVEASGGGIKLDVGDGEELGCVTDSSCDQIDLLFVIDNSGTMGEEQLNLAANLPLLVQQLQNLEDGQGNKINPSVNIMVTTTDMGHPLCTPFQKADYSPARGGPVADSCIARINRFTGLDPTDPVEIEEACTQNCPVSIEPGNHFIHFDGGGSNVPNDNVAAALSCIGPQGIDGCGYEATLESMLQAINPEACWNDPTSEVCQAQPEWQGVKKGFLRPGATLAVAIISDEVDCSTTSPDGYTYFTDDQTYWATNPDLQTALASSAVCWNAGVACDDTDGDGVYEECKSNQTGVLHSVERYVDYLRHVKEQQGKEVLMLGILGVPPVTEHNAEPPYEPTVGGVADLVYRDWRDGEYTGDPAGGDILPGEWAAGVTAEDKRFEFGNIGPGCTGSNDLGQFTGQAIPPVRIKEVCESLNYVDADGVEQVRCCIESICDPDFSEAMRCMSGIIQHTITPAG